MKRVLFSDLFKFEKKSTVKAGEGRKDGRYPFYTSSTELSKRIDDFLFDKQALIFGTGGQASIHYAKEKFSVSTDCLVASPIDISKIDSAFVYYYLFGNLRILEEGFKGAGLKHISKSYISEIDIPLPPIEIQKKIAAILDKANELRQNDKKILEKYDQLAQSVFLEMFGDPVKNEKGFKYCTIRDLVSEVKYGTSGKASDVGSYPYLRMNNITYSGYWDFCNLKFIDIPDKDKEKYMVKKGDVLFNRTNSKELVGKTGVFNLDREMAIAGYLIRIRVNTHANPYYLWGYLNSRHGKSTLNNMCKNIVGMANINAQELQEIRIQKAPIELQNRFAEVIFKILNQKQITEQSLQRSEELFQSLLQRAFKGELV